jgi:hypothetical protein
MCFGFSRRCSDSEERNIVMNFKIEDLVIGEKRDMRPTNRGDGGAYYGRPAYTQISDWVDMPLNI